MSDPNPDSADFSHHSHHERENQDDADAALAPPAPHFEPDPNDWYRVLTRNWGLPKLTAGEFYLVVEITGLCVFVPDGSSMHVLMPRTSGGMQHEARLCYADAYFGGSSTTVEKREDLFGHELVLPGQGGAMPNLKGLLDLSEFAGHGVPRRHLTYAAAPKPAARVVLGPGDARLSTDNSYWWVYDRDPREYDARQMCLPHIVWWTSRVQGPDLQVVLTRLDGTSASNGNRLRPVNNVIKVAVYHTIPKELPPLHQPGDPSDVPGHSRAFYDLLDDHRHRSVPHFIREGCPSFSEGWRDQYYPRRVDLRDDEASSPFTCVVAFSPPEP